jgi:GNAT superfamily N-acetyltransferase
MLRRMQVSNVKVLLAADRPDLVDQLATMYWKEWGSSGDLAHWKLVARSESQGRTEPPVSFLALDGDETVVGGVAISPREKDMPEDDTRWPWITGTLVHPKWRGKGVGTMLLMEVDVWLRSAGIPMSWVLTGGERAVAFYKKCGYRMVEERNEIAENAVVLENVTGAGTTSRE